MGLLIFFIATSVVTFFIRAFGNASVRRLAPIALWVAWFVVPLIFIVAHPDQSISSLAFDSIYILAIAAEIVIAGPILARRAGPFIYRFRTTRNTYIFCTIAALVCGVFAVMEIIVPGTLNNSNPTLYERGSFALAMAILGLAFLTDIRMKHDACERGLLIAYDFIAWEWIYAYEWTGKNDNVLTLFLSVTLPAPSVVRCAVNPADKEAIDRILAKNYLSRVTTV